MRASSYKYNRICAANSLIWRIALLWAAMGVPGLAAVLDDAADAYANARYEKTVQLLSGKSETSAAAAFLLGRAQFQLGDFDRASKNFERAVAVEPNNSAHMNWLGKAQGMRAERANPFSAMGLARKARDSFESAVKLDPANLEAVSDLFSYYIAAPGFLGGGIDKARTLAETVRSVSAGEYAFLRGELAEKSNDYPAAEKYYREAQTREPKKIGRWIDLAKFYTRRGMFDKADETLAKAKALAPNAPRLLFDEANLLVRSGRDPHKARALITKYQAASLTSEDPSPYDVRQLIEKLEKLEKK